MRKIIYSQMVSLDGFVEGSNGELDWSAPGDELHKHFNKLYLTGKIDTSLYGRKLYQNMAAYWPFIDNDANATDIEKEFFLAWKQIPKIVFSTTLKDVSWNAELKDKVNPEKIKKLKEKPGNNIEVGGATLAAFFIKQGMVDEFRLYKHPVVLGDGKPMFPAHKKLDLAFIDSRSFDCGVNLLRYNIKN